MTTPVVKDIDYRRALIESLAEAHAEIEQLRTLIRDLLWAMGHDDEQILNETTARAKAALERKYGKR